MIPQVLERLGFKPGERIAGFIYIGTATGRSKNARVPTWTRSSAISDVVRDESYRR